MNNGSLRKVFPFFLLLVLVAVFFLLFDYFGWLTGVEGFIQRPFLFLEKPLYSFFQSSRETVGELIDRSESQQIIELQTQIRQLAIDQNQLATCLEENEHLKKLLGAPLPADWQFKMARVVGLTDKMKLDLGADDGLKEGMTVVSENIYVGRIMTIGDNYSLVQLSSDINSRIPVVIKKTAASGVQARGLLVGQFGGKLLLDKVLQEESLYQGDLVVTAGEEGYLPDLVIGQIKEVLKGTAEVYQQAVVSSLVDYSSLRFVFVVVQ